jgi:drug/metabolite transporter (DMT)-like permease
MSAIIPAFNHVQSLRECVRAVVVFGLALFALPLLMKLAATEFTSFPHVGAQAVVGSLALLLLHIATKGDFTFTRSDWLLIGAISLLGVTAYRAIARYALTISLANSFSNLSLLILLAVIPVFVALLLLLFRRRSIVPWAALAAFISSLGVVVIFTGWGSIPVGLNSPVLILGLIAALTLAIYTLVLEPLLKRHPPLKVVATSTAIGSLPFVFTSATLIAQQGSVSLLAQGLTLAIAYLSWSYAIQRFGALLTTVYANLALILSGYFVFAWRLAPLNLMLGLVLLSLSVFILHEKAGVTRKPTPG